MTALIAARPTVAQFLCQRLEDVDKTEDDIATECRFQTPNQLNLLKTGAMKLPFCFVKPLAQTLGADPAHLMRLVMHDYMPDTWEDIESMMQSTALTANELSMIRAYRNATGDTDAPAQVSTSEGSVMVSVAERRAK